MKDWNFSRQWRSICLLCALLLPLSAEAQKTDTEAVNLIKAALKGWHVELRAGFLLGGTSPLPLPREIRAIENYNPTLCTSIGGSAVKAFDDSKWGLKVGVRLETKGMKTRARVKNYHMEMTADDGGYMEGAWTGHVSTRVRQTNLTFPILATYAIDDRWTVSAGPYLSWMYDGDFAGDAYDGNMRLGNPTGEKTYVDRASYDFSSDLRRFQWGIQAGAQWKAYKHLAIYADLEWGLNNIFPSDFKSVTFALYPIYLNGGIVYIF